MFKIPSLLLLLLLCTSAVTAQSLFDLLLPGDLDDPLPVTLTLPVDSVLNNAKGDLVASFSFEDQEAGLRTLPLEVSLRGKFRRTRCSNPPLKFNFSKPLLRGMGLMDFDKYKLVTACYEDSIATNLLLKEYLAYRAYAMVSPEAHYRVRLLDITYHDTLGLHPDRSDLGFLIEDTDQMALNAGGREIDEAIGMPATRFAADAEVTHALFQYLIGNGDWSLPLLRNVKVVERADGNLVPVGYDFDFSGWVGAPYASPSRELGQQSIYQRVYLGYSQSDATIRRVNNNFREQRRDLLNLVDDFELLPNSERQVLRRFIQRFYDSLATMSQNTGILMYQQLRGHTATVIPPGGVEKFYRTSVR